MTYPNGGSREETFAHELGHALMLEHAPFPVESMPGGARPELHDKADPGCLMGYNHSVGRRLCGLCNLTLRGWDPSKLKNDANLNHRG
jgi:hypothetical protein